MSFKMKFSALNVDFDGPSLDFLGSRKPVHEVINEVILTSMTFVFIDICDFWLQRTLQE